MNTPLSDLSVDQEIMNNTMSTLISDKALKNSKEAELEKEVVRITNSKAVRWIESLTSAVLILLKWYGVKPGDEVIVSSNTTCSVVLCVLQCGATPVMVDACENVDKTLSKLKKLITSKTKVIVAGDSGGVSSDYRSLMTLICQPDISCLFKARKGVQDKLNRILILADLTNSPQAKQLSAIEKSDISILLASSLKGLNRIEGGCACFNLPDYFDNQMVCNTLQDVALVEESKDTWPKFLKRNFGHGIRYHGARVKAPARSIKIGARQNSAVANPYLKMYLKRMFDLLFSTLGLIFLAPVILSICLLVGLSSKGPVFFKQKRVGYRMKDFDIIKFRTMYVNSQGNSLLTIGDKDPRVTKIGYWLRKYKIDELPQLFNVLKGDMSIVGPRPEVQKYVSLYSVEQQRVLLIKPGITDWSSIEFRNLAELLATAEDPDLYYVNHILPIKLNRSLQYVDEHSLLVDFQIIIMTLKKLILS